MLATALLLGGVDERPGVAWARCAVLRCKFLCWNRCELTESKEVLVFDCTARGCLGHGVRRKFFVLGYPDGDLADEQGYWSRTAAAMVYVVPGRQAGQTCCTFRACRTSCALAFCAATPLQSQMRSVEVCASAATAHATACNAGRTGLSCPLPVKFLACASCRQAVRRTLLAKLQLWPFLTS